MLIVGAQFSGCLHLTPFSMLFQIYMSFRNNIGQLQAVVMVQLAEWSLPIPEIRGSCAIIRNILYLTYLLVIVEKTKITKRGQECPIF